MNRIYAVAETVSPWARHYITPGRRYKLVPHECGCDERGLSPSGRAFAFRDDEGRVRFSRWEGSIDLGGGNWTHIEEAGE